MSKQVLDIQQMQNLEELGVDTSKASAAQTDIWVTSYLDEFQKAEDVLVFSESESDYFEFENPIKKFTLQDILDLLPKEMSDKDDDKFVLRVEYGISRKVWYIGYYYYDLTFNDLLFSGENIIDAAYEMLCWCIVNGYVETKK